MFTRFPSLREFLRNYGALVAIAAALGLVALAARGDDLRPRPPPAGIPRPATPIPGCMVQAPWGGAVHNGDLICYASDPRAPFAVFTSQDYPSGPGWIIDLNPTGTLWVIVAHGPGGEVESTTEIPVQQCARVTQAYCPPELNGHD